MDACVYCVKTVCQLSQIHKGGIYAELTAKNTSYKAVNLLQLRSHKSTFCGIH